MQLGRKYSHFKEYIKKAICSKTTIILSNKNVGLEKQITLMRSFK